MPEGKAQMMERKVDCLGHTLTEVLQCVGLELVQGILEVLLPRTEGKL